LIGSVFPAQRAARVDFVDQEEARDFGIDSVAPVKKADMGGGQQGWTVEKAFDARVGGRVLPKGAPGFGDGVGDGQEKLVDAGGDVRAGAAAGQVGGLGWRPSARVRGQIRWGRVRRAAAEKLTGCSLPKSGWEVAASLLTAAGAG
jgi:hypothetical protein